MHNRKIYLLKETTDDHRDVRFMEEAKKRKVDVVELDIYKSTITSECVVTDDGKVRFEDGDIVWTTSNASVSHQIIKSVLKEKKVFVWPSCEAVDFTDKFFANAFFSAHNIPVPRTVLISSNDFKGGVDWIGGFPCVIKRTKGSHGKQVELVRSEKEIQKFIRDSFQKALKHKDPYRKKFFFIIQECIKEANGSDYRVLCLKDEIIGAIKRISSDNGFRANVSLGGKAKKFQVDEKLEKLCKKIMKKGKLFYAGLDFIKSERGYLAIEVNTCAQFEGFEKATGINVAGKIVEKLLESA